MKGALIGAATVGGLGALIDRSISAADAIGKTADKIGLANLRIAPTSSSIRRGSQRLDIRHLMRSDAPESSATRVSFCPGVLAALPRRPSFGWASVEGRELCDA
jgi:hypothetical protein